MTITFKNPALRNVLLNNVLNNLATNVATNVANAASRQPYSRALFNLVNSPLLMPRLSMEPTNHAPKTSAEQSTFTPRVNIAENENEVTLYVELPGVKKEDVAVTINDERILTISGTKHPVQAQTQLQAATTAEDAAQEQTETTETAQASAEPLTYHRRERKFGTFTRRFALSKTIDAEQITATFEDGVLALTLQKVQPKTTTVEIQ
jgi:HSP20 family protein